MLKLVIPFLTTVVFVYSSLSYDENGNNDWDVLVFTQHYPLTQCIIWKQKSEKNNCSLPKDNKLWTIHGLWPTINGSTNQGPHFCNKTLKFNQTVIEPILNDLETYWINVEANTNLYSFWKKEWMKHGTCAVTLIQMNNQFKYFNMGLMLLKQYHIGDILAKSNVVPNTNPYNVNDTYDSLNKSLGVRPIMQCVSEKSKKHSLLSEVQICFNKSFQLIDCGVLKPNNTGMLTDCSLKKPLYYYNQIGLNRTFSTQSYYRTYYNKLVNLHKIITMLIKITL